MLKFNKPKNIKGYKQINITKNDIEYGKIWTFHKNPNWYAQLKGGKKVYIFSHKQKRMALNDALTFIETANDVLTEVN